MYEVQAAVRATADSFAFVTDDNCVDHVTGRVPPHAHPHMLPYVTSVYSTSGVLPRMLTPLSSIKSELIVTNGYGQSIYTSDVADEALCDFVLQPSSRGSISCDPRRGNYFVRNAFEYALCAATQPDR